MITNTLTWQRQSFTELDAKTLYDILKLRQDVFIIEQNCIYQDFDGKDPKAQHLYAYQSDVLIAYARLFAKDDYFADYCSFGRVVIPLSARGDGTGKALITKAIETIDELYDATPCKISAQCYLQNFYTRNGFIARGESYLEDGIPHIAMYRS